MVKAPPALKLTKVPKPRSGRYLRIMQSPRRAVGKTRSTRRSRRSQRCVGMVARAGRKGRSQGQVARAGRSTPCQYAPHKWSLRGRRDSTSPTQARSIRGAEASAQLRNRLLAEINEISSSDDAAAWEVTVAIRCLEAWRQVGRRRQIRRIEVILASNTQQA